MRAVVVVLHVVLAGVLAAAVAGCGDDPTCPCAGDPAQADDGGDVPADTAPDPDGDEPDADDPAPTDADVTTPTDPGGEGDMAPDGMQAAALGGAVAVMGWPPLPDARVALDGLPPVVPGPGGAFRFDGLAPGTHVLEATAGDLPATRVDLWLAPGEDRDLGTVAVSPARRVAGGPEAATVQALPGTHQVLFAAGGRAGIWDGDLHQAFDLGIAWSSGYGYGSTSPGGRVHLLHGSDQGLVAWLPEARVARLVGHGQQYVEPVFDRAEGRMATVLEFGQGPVLVVADLDTGDRREIPRVFTRPALTPDGRGLLHCALDPGGTAGPLVHVDLDTGESRDLHPRCTDLERLPDRSDGALRVLLATRPHLSPDEADLAYWEEGMPAARLLGTSVPWHLATPDGNRVAWVAGARWTPLAGPVGGDLRAWDTGSADEPVTVAADTSQPAAWLAGGRVLAGLAHVDRPTGEGPRSVLVVQDLGDGTRVEVASDVSWDDVRLAADGASLAALADVRGAAFVRAGQGDLWTWAPGQPEARRVARGVATGSVVPLPGTGAVLFAGGDEPGDWDTFAQAGRWRLAPADAGPTRDLGRRCRGVTMVDPTARHALGTCDVDETGLTGTLRLAALDVAAARDLGPWKNGDAWQDPLPAAFSADGSTLRWMTPDADDPLRCRNHLMDLSGGLADAVARDLPEVVDCRFGAGVLAPGGTFLWLGAPAADGNLGWTLRLARAATGDVVTLGTAVQEPRPGDLAADGRAFRFLGDFLGVRGNWRVVDLATLATVQVTDRTQPDDAWWSPAWDLVLSVSVGAFDDDGPLRAWLGPDGPLRDVDASVTRGTVRPDPALARAAWRKVKAGTTSPGTLRVGGLVPWADAVSIEPDAGSSFAWAGPDLVYAVMRPGAPREGVWAVTVPGGAGPTAR